MTTPNTPSAAPGRDQPAPSPPTPPNTACCTGARPRTPSGVRRCCHRRPMCGLCCQPTTRSTRCARG
jgi:hypothetical protein